MHPLKKPIFSISALLCLSVLLIELGLWGYFKHDAIKLGKTLAPLCKPPVILSLYQMMKDTDELLTAHEVPYLIFSGTLLGAVRHHGIIPWDDDIDIALPYEAQEAFIDLIPAFKKLGYYVLPAIFGYRIVKPKNPKMVWRFMGKMYFGDMTCIDVFVLSQVADKSVGYLPLWPNDYFYTHEVYPIKRYRFGELWVNGPQQATPYLSRAYGAQWNEVAYRQTSHATHPDTYERVALEAKHRVPAQPTGPLEDRIQGLLVDLKIRP
jgi:phosphorylcholine metabolism protein LicD